jgi:hypothetical protein
MYVCKIEWSEVCIEGHVCEIVVNVEEKRVLDVGWRLKIRYPVEFI